MEAQLAAVPWDVVVIDEAQLQHRGTRGELMKPGRL